VLVAFVGCSLFFVLPMFCKIMLLFASQFVARFLSRSPITIADNDRCIEMESQMRSPDELDAVNNVLEQDSLASYRGYMCEEGKYNPMATLSFQGQEKTIKVLFHVNAPPPLFSVCLPVSRCAKLVTWCPWCEQGYTEEKNKKLFEPDVLLVFFLVYFSMAIWTYGVRVPSGLFVPGIICGCCFGRAMGELVKENCDSSVDGCAGHLVHPGTYSLIGAASMLGGMTRMTISLVVILLETTNDIQYLLPIMMVLMIAKWIGDWFVSAERTPVLSLRSSVC